jgi:hypothetical protein
MPWLSVQFGEGAVGPVGHGIVFRSCPPLAFGHLPLYLTAHNTVPHRPDGAFPELLCALTMDCLNQLRD